MTKKNKEQNKEKEFLNLTNSHPMYAIYQLKEQENLIDYFFTSYKELKEKGYNVDYNNYKFIYSAELDKDYVNLKEPKVITLENIYRKFNTNHPEDYKGHSLSISDIVVFKNNNKFEAHYVDTFGFKEVPEFLSNLDLGSLKKKSDMEM